MNDEDANLFSNSMAGVKPLLHDNRVKTEKQRPKPSAKFSIAQQQAPLQVSLATSHFNAAQTGDTLNWHRPGVQKSVARKLRRGQYPVKDELDLHGLNQQQAKRAVHDFLNHAGMHQFSCVRVIHGKGHRSEYGPVLKRAVAGWLIERPDVVAFSSAPSHDGGTGAVYILLKRMP